MMSPEAEPKVVKSMRSESNGRLRPANIRLTKQWREVRGWAESEKSKVDSEDDWREQLRKKSSGDGHGRKRVGKARSSIARPQ